LSAVAGLVCFENLFCDRLLYRIHSDVSTVISSLTCYYWRRMFVWWSGRVFCFVLWFMTSETRSNMMLLLHAVKSANNH
jgi:hypothetical protein